MGVLYIVHPYREADRPWLEEYGAVVASGTPPGRNMSADEVRSALQSVRGYRVEVTPQQGDGSFQISFETPDNPEAGPWALLNVSPHKSVAGCVDFYFSKGWPVAVLTVAEQLSRHCGSLVVAPDTGDAPVIVTPGIDPEALSACL